ncbi:hypothetical protein AC1031_008028 [Aphanomyces cochlioides]|nr:hypothetical protein AC1031_008028 [Aphanomyces cochlioides]
MEANYVPEYLTSRFIDTYDRTLRANKVFNESNYLVDPSLHGDALAIRQAGLAAYEHRYRKATFERLSKTTLANLRSEAIIFLNSALSSQLRSCFSKETDPYSLYQAIRARFEDHPTRTDPSSILRSELRVSWTPGEACDNVLDLLKEHQTNYRNVMQPSEWHNISVNAYATHFWDLRYLVRAFEVFQREDSIWEALRKLLQAALKNGSIT